MLDMLRAGLGLGVAVIVMAMIAGMDVVTDKVTAMVTVTCEVLAAGMVALAGSVTCKVVGMEGVGNK